MKKLILGILAVLACVFVFNSVEGSYNDRSTSCRLMSGTPAPRGWFESTRTCTWSKQVWQSDLMMNGRLGQRFEVAEPWCKSIRGRLTIGGTPYAQCSTLPESLF